MLKFNNSIVPNKVCIGWHFSSNKYAYKDVYSALKSITPAVCWKLITRVLAWKPSTKSQTSISPTAST